MVIGIGETYLETNVTLETLTYNCRKVLKIISTPFNFRPQRFPLQGLSSIVLLRGTHLIQRK